MDNNDRLKKQLEFMIEIDKIKHVFRKTKLIDGSRHENDAEHAWHLAVIAMVLLEHVNEPKPDLCKVIKMVLVHDLVEIDAGDTFVYDQQNNKTKALREQKAADRIFSILPDDQRDTFRELWDEFEERKTPEAKFAAAIDRFEPILQNYLTKGYAWQEHNITKDMVLNTNKKIADGSKILWEHVKSMIDDSVKQGFLQD